MSEESSTYEGETFVYGDKEVMKTGRTASRTKRSKRSGLITTILIEVRPLAMLDKTSNMYNAWVDENELYHIKGEDKE